MPNTAEERNDDTIQVRRGRAEFIGTDKQDGSDAEQRADARRAYEKAVSGFPVSGASKLWQGLHHRWAKAAGSLSAAARRGLNHLKTLASSSPEHSAIRRALCRSR
jgi:hypothetical protein